MKSFRGKESAAGRKRTGRKGKVWFGREEVGGKRRGEGGCGGHKTDDKL